MADFKVIETEEQFEEAVKDRLKTERETVKKQYEGYLSPEDVTKKYAGYLSPEDVTAKYEKHLSPEDAAKLNAKIKGYEINELKAKVAHEVGLSYDAVHFLSGDDEAGIKQSAETLKGLIGANNVAPLANPEGGISGGQEAALKNTLKGLKGE